MNIACNKPNRRKQLKCLRDFMNGLRQLNNQPIFKSIAKYKKQFDVSTAKEAYEIADNLQRTAPNVYPAEYFRVFDNLIILLSTFAGKTVRVMYLDTVNYDSLTIERKEAYDKLKNSEDGFEEVDKTYDLSNFDEFAKDWGDKHVWNWRTSDNTVFAMNDYFGNVYITESITITPKRIHQSYLDNEQHNCIFKPIIAICNKQINNPELSSSSQSKYNTILNKLKKITPKYVNGVPDNELDDVFKQLKIKMTLALPFCDKTVVYGDTSNKARMVLNYINTRLNHVELAGEYYNNNKPVMLIEEEFNDLYQSLIDNNKFFIYQMSSGEGRVNRVYSIKTIDNSYRLANNEYDALKEFESDNEFIYYSVDDVADDLLSKFIRVGGHMTSSRINPAYKDDLITYVEEFEEIDGTKAYAKFKHCSWYEGFMSKPADFRQSDVIEGIGYYLIGNIDWTNANPQIKLIQQTFNLYSGRNIYISPELKFMMDNGLTFKIYGGCWGVKFDFDFSESMLNGKYDGVPNYSRWTGLCSARNPYTTYYMDTNDTEYAGHITEECMNASYNNGRIRFTVNRDRQPHKAHIGGFIYGYQRINLIEQLMKMDISRILRINTDGIKYLPHDFELNSIFRREPITTKKKTGLIMGDREEGLLTNINDCDARIWFQFHMYFRTTTKRKHYDNELYIGAGGCGKTHINIIDTGLIRPLYVANAYKLTRAKAIEYSKYGIRTEVLANVLSPMRYDYIRKNFNTIILDEASMISEEARAKIFNMYSKCKLIFCGDIGYQADPIEGTIMNTNTFQHMTRMNVNYRCLDDKLATILRNVRDAIDNKQSVYELLDDIQRISRSELVEKYKPTDMVLTHTLRTQEIYNELLDAFEKYVITKSDENFSRGEIYYEKQNTKNIEKRNAFTTHSVQGETFTENIYIDLELIANRKLIYTALSRAKRLNQLFIITP